MVRITVVFAVAVFGVTLWTVTCAAKVAVPVAVGVVTVGDGSPGVMVGNPVGEGVNGVADIERRVGVSTGVRVTGVAVDRGVNEDTGVSVGVINIGAPNSRHPRSGAAPAKPVIG